jgi:hypothetical protein
MGTAMTVRDLIGERAIFQREYSVGLFPDLYLASKIAVLGAASFIQGVLVTIIGTFGYPGPDFGGSLHLGRLEIALAIGALTFTMSIVGLGMSALVTASEQTMPALVGMVMLQLVLSGALVQVAGRPILEQLSWLSPARWAYAAASSTTSIQRPARQQGESLDWIALHGFGHWLLDMLMLGLLCAVAIAVARAAVRRSATQR